MASPRMAATPGTRRGRAERAPVRSEPESDARYSIRVTSRLTGVELETLRIWERRYGFPRPARTTGGARLYSAADVEALKLIRRAIEHGYRAGEVVGKPGEELARLILAASQGPGAPILLPSVGAPSVTSLLRALVEDRVAAVRDGLRQAALGLGPRRFLVEVVQPLSVRVGEMWAEGKLDIRHEHLMSECLSSQLRLLASSFEEKPGSPCVLLATLPGERHGLGLEMIEVYLGSGALAPLRLGVDTPPDQIVEAARRYRASAVGLLVTRASDLAVTARQVRWMLGELPRRVAIWLGGGGAPELAIHHEAVRVVATWSDLDAAIAALSPSRGAIA